MLSLVNFRTRNHSMILISVWIQSTELSDIQFLWDSLEIRVSTYKQSEIKALCHPITANFKFNSPCIQCKVDHFIVVLVVHLSCGGREGEVKFVCKCPFFYNVIGTQGVRKGYNCTFLAKPASCHFSILFSKVSDLFLEGLAFRNSALSNFSYSL